VAQSLPGDLVAPLASSSLASRLAFCLGDRPHNFSVCIFGPALFAFSVDNSNVAAALLIRRSFSAGSFKFVVVSSFREAFELSQRQPAQLEVEDDWNSNFEFSLGYIMGISLCTWSLWELFFFNILD
jgi:hypothetical protein